jgi:uncharacterized protein YceK
MINTVWLIPGEGGEQAYGGVRLDCEMIAKPETATGIEPWQKILPCIDIPFSVVADTLTLPYILAIARERKNHPTPMLLDDPPGPYPTDFKPSEITRLVRNQFPYGDCSDLPVDFLSVTAPSPR